MLKRLKISGIIAFLCVISCNPEHWNLERFWSSQNKKKATQKISYSGCQEFSRFSICLQGQTLEVRSRSNQHLFIQANTTKWQQTLRDDSQKNQYLQELMRNKNLPMELYLYRPFGSMKLSPVWVLHLKRESLILNHRQSSQQVIPLAWTRPIPNGQRLEDVGQFFSPGEIRVQFNSHASHYSLITLSYFFSILRVAWNHRPVYQRIQVPLGSESRWLSRLEHHPLSKPVIADLGPIPRSLPTGEYAFVLRTDP